MNKVDNCRAALAAKPQIDSFFDLSFDLVCIVDTNGRFIRLSRSWEDAFGYSMDELMAATFLGFVHPDDQAATVSVLQTHARGKPVDDFVNRCRTRDGQYRVLSWRTTIADEDDLIFAIAHDVTEQRRTMQDLSDERTRLRAIMDSIADLVFIKDRDLRYLGCNRPFEDFIARSEHDLIGGDDFDFFPVDEARLFRGNDIATLCGMTPRRNEEWLTYADGRRRLFDTQKVPLRDADGQTLGVVGVSRDITEQARLRGEVDFLGAMVNHSRYPVWCINPARGFTITYANEAACTFLGLPRGEILASLPSRFDPVMTPDWLERIWARIQISDAPILIETGLRAANGKIVPVEISASRLRHQDQDYVVGWIHDISVRQATQLQLREREALYRASVEATIDGFWQVDGSGRIVDANTAYARMSGYSVTELCGMHIHDLEAEKCETETEERIFQIKTQGALIFESQHRRKDGSVWDVEVNVLHSDLSGGRFFVYLRDLRRRRLADVLLKTRVRLAEIGRNGDIDQLKHEVVVAAQHLTASTTGFFHFAETTENMDLPEIRAQSLQQGRPVICNDPVADAVSHRLMLVPILDKGRIFAVIGVGNKASDYDNEDAAAVAELAVIARDIVSWVQAERARQSLSAALAQTARQWSVAMENFKGGVAVLDSEHRLLRANAAFFTLTASSVGRIGTVVRGLAGNVEAVDSWLDRDNVEMVLEADDPVNPSHRPLEVRTTRIHDAVGTPQGMLLSLYDLTRLREQERRLELTIGELTRSNAELERFGQVAAHDLQEPTRRQVLFAQLLQRKLAGLLDDEGVQYLEFLISDALKMRDMVDALGIYHQAGQSLRPSEPVDLDQVVGDVLNTLVAEIDVSHALLCLSPLGETRGECWRLHLLFVNLLSNALRFRRPGSTPRIVLSAEKCGDRVLVSVADNGIGIPEQYRSDLFTLFRRLGCEQGVRSTGMGLAQCRRIVEDLGGRIWIEGNDCGGCTVKFTLPPP